MLVRHLTETDPYMEQVLSPMGAHSVSGDTAPVIIECHPGPNLTKMGPCVRALKLKARIATAP